ncbi:unnamed protein product [Heterobilharzia americana]|nr:unnamed protein product [Heterobilharzia americana]
MSSVQSIFKQLLLLLPLLPRHNTYAHSILSLATQITKLVKRRPQCCLDGVLECLDNISINECPYRNALKRINANLKKLISFREAKSKANDEETPTSSLSKYMNTVPIDSQNLNSKGNLRKLKSKKMTKKAVSKKKKVVRKRVFPEATDVNYIYSNYLQQCDADSTRQAEDVVHESCPKRMKLQTNTESENTINSDIPSHPNETSTVLTDESKPNIDCFTSPNVLVDLSEQEKHVAYTPLSSERRVSFGKVFRKKFSATRCISLTPPVSVIPAKGILRGNKSFPEEARVNVSF